MCLGATWAIGESRLTCTAEACVFVPRPWRSGIHSASAARAGEHGGVGERCEHELRVELANRCTVGIRAQQQPWPNGEGILLVGLMWMLGYGIVNVMCPDL